MARERDRANDKMTGIPVMRAYNPGCRDAIRDVKIYRSFLHLSLHVVNEFFRVCLMGAL